VDQNVKTQMLGQLWWHKSQPLHSAHRYRYL